MLIWWSGIGAQLLIFVFLSLLML